MLTVLNKLDERLLKTSSRQLHRLLSGPTLLHLPGRIKRPLFVSVLQHGNEDSGWETLRRLLRGYQGQKLPRALSVFIGNVAAARYGKRKLKRQPDFNRVWEDRETPAGEAAMMREIVSIMRRKRVFASIDIHNNSGFNPHYACINRLSPDFLQLASGFSRPIVYFIRPRGVQSRAFARLCPAVTLECGQPGDEYGIQLAARFVDRILNLTDFSAGAPAPGDYDLFHTIAIVKMPPASDFSFDGSPARVRFIKGIERLNFEEIGGGSTIAHVHPAAGQPFNVQEESGRDIFGELFAVEEDKLINLRPVIPSMLTTDIEIVRQDCLCYLMERYDPAWGEKNDF